MLTYSRVMNIHFMAPYIALFPDFQAITAIVNYVRKLHIAHSVSPIDWIAKPLAIADFLN